MLHGLAHEVLGLTLQDLLMDASNAGESRSLDCGARSARAASRGRTVQDHILNWLERAGAIFRTNWSQLGIRPLQYRLGVQPLAAIGHLFAAFTAVNT